MDHWITTLISCCEENHCRYAQQEALEKHCTFRVGGPAELFVWVQTAEQCAALLHCANEESVPVHILGKGSNLLISDRGVKGVVLYMEPQQRISVNAENEVRAWAGESVAQLCQFALEQGLSGLEFAYGIPGSVGGAVYMNAGAYGGEIKDCLKWVSYLDESLQLQKKTVDELQLSYRHSLFSGRNCVILEACFQLQTGEKAAMKERMDEVMQKRREKQPLEYPSAGSTFKRPEGAFAAALIDQCGLKGRRIGGVSISEKHAGFLVNDRKGSCQDILDLIHVVQRKVEEQTGYWLETEVEYWGEE